jgi:thiol:disulfide interchange protein DsbC
MAHNTDMQLKAKVQQSLPGRKIDSMTLSPVKGVYEVVLEGRQIVYVNSTGEYALVGEMIDLKTRKNLTQSRMESLNVVNFLTLPLHKAIKEVRGDGSRKVAIFSDPDCPFCIKLDQNMKQIDNVTIYTFFFPLSIHPDAPRKSRLIWCAPDQAKAWQQWVVAKKLPNNTDACDTPLSDVGKLVESLKITGTPAIIFESGRLVSGAIGVSDIEALLAEKKQ